MKSTRRLSLFAFVHDAPHRWIEAMAFSRLQTQPALGEADGHQRSLSGTGRPARDVARLSARRRPALAARSHAAQHLRAALSRARRRRAADGPADRHDPARRGSLFRGARAEALRHGVRRAHHPIRRDGRWALPRDAHRRCSLRGLGRALSGHALSAMPGRFPQIS